MRCCFLLVPSSEKHGPLCCFLIFFVWLRAVWHSAESDFTPTNTARCQTPRQLTQPKPKFLFGLFIIIHNFELQNWNISAKTKLFGNIFLTQLIGSQGRFNSEIKSAKKSGNWLVLIEIFVFSFYHSVLFFYFYTIHRVICRPSDHSVGKSQAENPGRGRSL